MLYHTQGLIHLSEKADIKSTHVFLSILVLYCHTDHETGKKCILWHVYVCYIFIEWNILLLLRSTPKSLSLKTIRKQNILCPSLLPFLNIWHVYTSFILQDCINNIHSNILLEVYISFVKTCWSHVKVGKCEHRERRA